MAVDGSDIRPEKLTATGRYALLTVYCRGFLIIVVVVVIVVTEIVVVVVVVVDNYK